MPESPRLVFSFPPFRLDSSQRLVTHDGQPISLTPKEFDTLLVLVEAAGRVVDKEELINRVWPNSFVGDGSLARNISVLRKSLGGGCIETHRGRGYRIALPIITTTSSPVVAPTELLREREARTASSAGEAEVEEPGRWRRGVVIASVTAVVLLITFAVFHSASVWVTTARADKADATPIHSIFIEKNGGVDPLDEGFKLHQPLEPKNEHDQVLYNRETNGWDRWRIRTNSQNYYYRPLSEEQKDFALRRDWTLTCVCALEEGGGFADVDLGGRAGRFDMEFLREGDRYFVALTKGISPKFDWAEKFEYPGVADVAHPHTFELRFDHVTQSASLWIDGQQIYSGYRGHHQYLEDRGLMFGAAIYGNAEYSSFVFRTVRFEVN